MLKCRVCLIKCENSPESHMNLADKLQVGFMVITIRDALSEIAQIPITNEEVSKICSNCCARLREAYAFVKRVQESAEVIREEAHKDPSLALPYTITNTPLQNIGPSYTCLDNIQIESVHTYQDMKSEDIGSVGDVLIKTEPECHIDDIEYGCDVPYADTGQFGISTRDDKTCQTVNFDYVGLDCICQYFTPLSKVSNEMRASIVDKFFAMSDDEKNVYLRSLLHPCRCGRNVEKRHSDETSKPRSVGVVYCLEFEGKFFSVSREVFIDVFCLAEKQNKLQEHAYSQSRRSSSNDGYGTEYLNSEYSMENGEVISTSGEGSVSSGLEQKPYTENCMLCGKWFKNIATLKRHVIVYHTYLNGRVNTQEDTESDDNTNALLQEVKKARVKRNIKNYSVPCEFCLRKFLNTTAMVSHKKFCSKRPHYTVSYS